MTAKAFFIWIGVAIALIAVLFFAAMFLFVRPSRGERIASYPSPRAALVVIDIQQDYTGPQARKRYRDGDKIVTASNALIAQARARGDLVVFIRNEIDNFLIATMFDHINAPGTPGAQLDRRLAQSAADRTFVKHRPDSFSNAEFDAFLREHQVDRLMITGLDAAYCVNATTRGALNRGYKVTLYREAIATESGKSIDELARGWRDAGAQVRADLAL
ncbi:cysteine hydrolase family protein [Niveibacterium terrae]|uniref:cysteine hydrolase family protein n=1 Tax=Niveibacterium terrae TaxID=3373598 RepID=UPI003A8E334E